MVAVKHEAPPNWRGRCLQCGSEFERYLRPSRVAPQFCSQHCRLVTFGRGPKTPDHLRKIGEAKARERHHLWKGDDVSERSGRSRAQRWFAEKKPCQKCGSTKRPERHHVDGNTANNEPSNIMFLCRRCHMTEDGRINRMKDVRRGISTR
jgi:5-methylcytosine-specific restriction endonuclease McrA